ncbi:hypothetical protein [Arthrobacter sp. Helios]|uniref:hypothetical protein n=1 Tax=Arthrobacter sp. Helios TaxID=2828862 RepID=UPI00205B1D1D|nr:hypothetical protein [Arthrobacter sp. Helios]UPO76527.1 hypothetical protein ArtHe_14425 [Arthrobacter sp. Helios]
MENEPSFVPGVSRWRADGSKLTGAFGTWRGSEYELRDVRPSQYGTLTLVSRADLAPGPEWKTCRRHPNNFAATPVDHILRVPADEVSGVQEVEVTGDMGRGRQVRILAEDAEGRLAVMQSSRWEEADQRRLISSYGFRPFSDNEPLSHQSVAGWIPAERVHDIRSTIEKF